MIEPQHGDFSVEQTTARLALTDADLHEAFWALYVRPERAKSDPTLDPEPMRHAAFKMAQAALARGLDGEGE